mmetsp:Transcript_14441/g.24246  ORF Transcript_14441/g.24246 Transcript_14441/m.24246 type:complete len:279 (+) Transcript_14441:103-939(+)
MPRVLGGVEWQPDDEAPACAICKKKFTSFFRRHHCRTCGRVVCNSCSTNRMKKPKITGYKGKVRVCDECWEDFAPNHLHRKSGVDPLDATFPRTGPSPSSSSSSKAKSPQAPVSLTDYQHRQYQHGVSEREGGPLPRFPSPADEHSALLRTNDSPDYYSRWNLSAIDLERALSARRRHRRATHNTWSYYMWRLCCYICCCHRKYRQKTDSKKQFQGGGDTKRCCWCCLPSGYKGIRIDPEYDDDMSDPEDDEDEDTETRGSSCCWSNCCNSCCPAHVY